MPTKPMFKGFVGIHSFGLSFLLLSIFLLIIYQIYHPTHPYGELSFSANENHYQGCVILFQGKK